MIDDLMNNLGITRSDYSNQSDQQRSEMGVNYVSNDYHDGVIQQLRESLQVHDVCLIGPRGSGKSTLVSQLAKLLSLEIEPIMLYQVIWK